MRKAVPVHPWPSPMFAFEVLVLLHNNTHTRTYKQANLARLTCFFNKASGRNSCLFTKFLSRHEIWTRFLGWIISNTPEVGNLQTTWYSTCFRNGCFETAESLKPCFHIMAKKHKDLVFSSSAKLKTDTFVLTSEETSSKNRWLLIESCLSSFVPPRITWRIPSCLERFCSAQLDHKQSSMENICQMNLSSDLANLNDPGFGTDIKASLPCRPNIDHPGA